MTEASPAPSLARRIAWFMALWCGSVAALGAVAWLIRVALKA